MEEAIFKPLGMKDTCLLGHAPCGKNSTPPALNMTLRGEQA